MLIERLASAALAAALALTANVGGARWPPTTTVRPGTPASHREA